MSDTERQLLILALISGLLFVFAPGLSTPLTAAARARPWSRFGLGLCLVVGLPVLGVLVFTMGFPFGLWWLGLFVLMYSACLLPISMAVAGLVLGAWLLDRSQQRRALAPAAFVIGLVIVTLLGIVPYLGALASAVALVYGAGALILLPRGRTVPGVAPLEGASGVSATGVGFVEPPVRISP